MSPIEHGDPVPPRATPSAEKNPWLSSDAPRGRAYDARFAAMSAAGQHVHGEADFVVSLAPSSVLDAGCGTGRVAIELDRRGIDVTGVDLDPTMLEVARAKAPQLDWQLGDLAEIDLGRRYDLVLAAGNVMRFIAPASHARVLERLYVHLHSEGLLVAGFSLDSHVLSVELYDELASGAGFELLERFGSWDKAGFSPKGDYALSVHQKR